LRFNFFVAAHLVSALHSSVFARLASGAFYEIIVLAKAGVPAPPFDQGGAGDFRRGWVRKNAMKKFIRFLAVITFLVAGHCLAPAIGILDVEDLNILTPADLANQLMGGGAVISNVTFSGAPEAAGSFKNGLVDGIGIDRGILLTTGDVLNAIGPNVNTAAGRDNFQPGDAALDVLVAPQSTFDAAVLEFDFTTLPAPETIISFSRLYSARSQNPATGWRSSI
jgi:hypothetical protein